jgi:sorbitol-specific phosphotransferase system component IIA
MTVISNSDCLHTNGSFIFVSVETDLVFCVIGSRVPLFCVSLGHVSLYFVCHWVTCPFILCVIGSRVPLFCVSLGHVSLYFVCHWFTCSFVLCVIGSHVPLLGGKVAGV